MNISRHVPIHVSVARIIATPIFVYPALNAHLMFREFIGGSRSKGMEQRE
jgi:hypothetical protein